MKTAISKLGKVAFMERLLSGNTFVGDDAAMIDRGEYIELLTQASMMEGVDFDLTYFPLKHLGYKAVVKVVSNIYAMNGRGEYLTVSLGLSRRFMVEDVEEIYEGIAAACADYGLELAGGDTSASLTGLMISMTCVGRVDKDKVARRGGAQISDLVCISGGLGAAFMGLKLLEREKRALAGNSGVQPQLAGHEYILGKQLRPSAPKSVIDALEAQGVVPTSMIDINKGLASAVLNICNRSGVGMRLMLERLPIAKESFAMAEELGIDAVTGALNGGDDFELLFTVPATMHKDVLAMGEVIGFVTAEDEGAIMLTPDGGVIRVMSPDFTVEQSEE